MPERMRRLPLDTHQSEAACLEITRRQRFTAMKTELLGQVKLAR